MTRPRPMRERACAWLRALLRGGAAAALLWTAVPGEAQAAPRDDVRGAYDQAKEQFNNLELDQALATLDAAVARAEGAGIASDPTLGPLHVLRGGIIFSNTGNRAQALAAFKQAVACDYNSTLPIELRSPELQKLLEEARRGTTRPSNDAIVHTAPVYGRGGDVEVAAQANVPLPDGAQLVLYWRKAGDSAEFTGVSMTTFGNFGTATIAAAEHADAGIEYFIYAFDANGSTTLANRGDKEHPLVIQPSGDAAVVAAGGEQGKTGDDGKPEQPKNKPKKNKGKSKLPRVFINLGFGTGAGIARGSAELTYQQFTPGPGSTSYQTREQACALGRWATGRGALPDQVGFSQKLNAISGITGVLPASVGDLTAAYDQDYCSQHHPVTTGLASAPFHIAPEVGVRVSNRIVLSLFARLQVVTGSRVFTENPTKRADDSFNNEVRSPNPPGFRRRPPFTWAIGLKLKYFFGKDDRKFRVFAGGFAGYGHSRLRVNMGFTNDRNGNSVPDAIDIGYSGPAGPNGTVDVNDCVVVWPYTSGCVPPPPGEPPPGDPGVADRKLAQDVATGTSSNDIRIDTVKIGPGFVGGLVGFNYQLVKHFALFAEFDVGVWFPATSSALFDLTVGPVITF
ncbi:MAG: hypothetical protein IAG13_12200 [Deltaproteobacteria bacterium]|nr:hypothetical protein [Nannocystaceae bacterium]